ncbi:MAG TPA: hypothetical protein VI564_06275 [Candidatus Nanoarchaeia archaeon]|nr:hypothetical protein [Candidatus Nanoarchaeia archaeon]
MLTSKQIADIIKNKYPDIQVDIIDKGEIQNISDFRRCSIQAHIFGSLLKFNYGENLVLILDDDVVDAIKHVALLHPNEITKAINYWLDNIQTYLTSHELPIVKHLARKWLGKEEKIEKKPRILNAFYDLFFVSINPFTAFLFLKSTRRLVYIKRFNNQDELEEFFKLAAHYAQEIRAGQIK